jgi:hypothetical protein
MNVPAPLEAPERGPETSARWLAAIERVLDLAESAELELSRHGGDNAFEQRKASGSYYTPADVAYHFWDLFFRHHRIDDPIGLAAFISKMEFVEPSAGSGIFVFSFFKKAVLIGATPEQFASVRFHVVDINLAALRFFSERLHELEAELGVSFGGVGPSQDDFLQWVETRSVPNAVFVGNPPFVTNPRGSRWRNLYADFVEAVLTYPSTRAASLILPLSVCFSRDYSELRAIIRASGMGISTSSYDNIPDCLFKAGKPDSTNTNRANSQRCTILNLGGPDPDRREATALQNWAARDRASFLKAEPSFRAFDDNDLSGQLPRPASEEITRYLLAAKTGCPLKTLLSRVGPPAFAVGGVARNFIGIRDFDVAPAGIIPIKVSSEGDRWLLLQVLSSKLFFDYWRTYGDGFHVTVDLIERFPLANDLIDRLRRNCARAEAIWHNRAAFAKEKLNSGKLVKSYDFRGAFE